jgi:transposase
MMNNLAERMLRAQAIGRRNWTFLGSDRGGRTAAVLYSLTGTCRHHDIDPFAYLRDVLTRLPSLHGDQLGALLPDVWFTSHPRRGGRGPHEAGSPVASPSSRSGRFPVRMTWPARSTGIECASAHTTREPTTR